MVLQHGLLRAPMERARLRAGGWRALLRGGAAPPARPAPPRARALLRQVLHAHAHTRTHRYTRARTHTHILHKLTWAHTYMIRHSHSQCPQHSIMDAHARSRSYSYVHRGLTYSHARTLTYILSLYMYRYYSQFIHSFK